MGRLRAAKGRCIALKASSSFKKTFVIVPLWSLSTWLSPINLLVTNLLKWPLCARHRARHYGMTMIFRDILPILEFIAQQAMKPASRSGLEAVLIETCSRCCFQGGWRQGLKNIKRGLHTPSISRNCFSSMGELFASEGSNSKCSAPILACSWDVHSCHK